MQPNFLYGFNIFQKLETLPDETKIPLCRTIYQKSYQKHRILCSYLKPKFEVLITFVLVDFCRDLLGFPIKIKADLFCKDYLYKLRGISLLKFKEISDIFKSQEDFIRSIKKEISL